MGERGSRKNRLFLWFRNLKQNRKKKQDEKERIKKEKEEQRKKQNKIYSRPEIVLKTIIGLFLGALENFVGQKKQKENPLKKIDDKLNLLTQDIEALQRKINENGKKEVKIEIWKMWNEEQLKQGDMLKEVKKQITTIEKKKSNKSKSEIEKRKKQIIQLEQKNIETSSILNKEKQKIDKKEEQKKKKAGTSIEEEKMIVLASILKQELNHIKQNINYNDLDRTIYKLEHLQEKTFPYQNNNKIKQILSETNQLKKDCKIKQEQIKDNIKNRKMKVLSKNELIKKELILKINKQQQLMEKMNQQILSLPSKKKKNGILKTLSKLITSTFLTGFGISRFLKKKVSMFDIFLGAIFTNYGIRGMRNLGKEKENQVAYLDAKKVVEQLSSEKKALEMSTLLYEDSIEQLITLKKEFLLEYGNYNLPYITNLKDQLDELEIDLKKKLKILYQNQEKMEYIIKNGKEKVKRLEV